VSKGVVTRTDSRTLDDEPSRPSRWSWRKTILLGQAIVTLILFGAAIWPPRPESGRAGNDLPAAFDLLIRTHDIRSEIFICPTTQPSVALSLNAENGGGGEHGFQLVELEQRRWRA
jgi:hypothetical protein